MFKLAVTWKHRIADVTRKLADVNEHIMPHHYVAGEQETRSEFQLSDTDR